ncbi:MAG: hypothetical protein AB8I08_15865 [Sandaracinaceae bacterium]
MPRFSFLIVLLVSCAPSVPSTELYDGPWPASDDVRDDGTVDLGRFPSGTQAPLRREVGLSLAETRGFGRTSGVFFPFAVALDPASLPTVEASSLDEASVFLMALDSGERAVVDVRFIEDAGPFGGTHLLALLPFPGMPLLPDTEYAAVVTTRVSDLAGAPLPAASLHNSDMHAVRAAGIEPTSVAALTRYRTGDPTRGLIEAAADVASRDPLVLEGPPRHVETHDRYCVFEATMEVPVFQRGTPPYLEQGGSWVVDADDRLVRQRTARSRVVLTVPRNGDVAPRRAAVFVRAGGGGDRPLVDRGPRDENGDSVPGSGIATQLAEAGVIGASFDGPLGGARNLGGWDEQVVLFNLFNAASLRDNIRQSALEHALFAHLVEQLEFSSDGCPDAAPVTRVRPGPVLIAHSNGATIAPLAAAAQPRYRALVLSGAGSSWIRQVVHKESPAPLRPIVSLLFGYGPHRETFEHDPMLSLMAWAGEPADPLVYAPLLRDRERLVFQGVRDTYIPPPIANPTALALGLRVEGAALDGAAPRGVLRDLALAALPDDTHVHALVQLPEDGIEDGHEVFFQQPAARRRLVRFLRELPVQEAVP